MPFKTIRTRFQRLSLVVKLTGLGVITATAAVTLGSAIVIAFLAVAEQRSMVRDVGTIVDIAALNSAAAVMFEDASAASENATALRANPHVITAVIVLPGGRALTRFDRDPAHPRPVPARFGDGESHRFSWREGMLATARPIMFHSELIGTLYVESDLDQLAATARMFSVVLGFVLAIASGVSLLLARRLQRVISDPLLRLTNATRSITQEHRYDNLVEKSGDDEIGELVDGFNEMLRGIKDRDERLTGHQEELEHTVEDRTAALRAANSDLTAARDKAMEASRAKSEFLANMSHEIRTPMNGVLGMTELALGTELTAQQRDYLVTVKASAASLLGILNDILDFSKIEARKLQLESIPFSVRDVVATMLKPLAVKAEQKGLELLYEIDPDVPAGIAGDPIRLQQVLSNLVGNAIKFTEQGHVLVEIREDARVDGSTLLHFRVNDSGIGIPADKHATIFEAFSQADGSTTRKFGGTGLGLTISATLVHMMGGRIWVESEPGAGSSFQFTAGFPIAELADARVRPGLAAADARVLIIDDNPVNRQILLSQLANWHTTPSAVESGRQGLELLAAAEHEGRPFSLVLLDVNMPELDGFQVAAEISRRPELSGATIMMLSSSGGHDEPARCKELGVAAYLTKPIESADLRDAVCRVLNCGATGEAERPAPATVPTGPLTRALNVLLAEDNEVNQLVAVGLLARRGHEVTVANNGVEALAEFDRKTFDVVLMDVQMPEMGGFEATAGIREREQATRGHVRIVAMTAHAMSGDRERCLAAGMDDYLSKPVDPVLLFRMVEQEPGATSAEATAAPGATNAIVDYEQLMRRVAGDPQLCADVVRMFLTDCPSRLVEIKAAVDARDAQRIRTSAHTLKGAAGNLSANGLFEAARVLERIGAEMRLDAAPAAWRALSAVAAQVIAELNRFELGAHAA